MPTWEFPSNNHGQIYGISDSGVETFLGTPIRSLAREICQNSLDAAIDNDKPAHVSFSTFDLNTSTLPDIVGLRSAFQNALDFWSLQNSDKTKKFFRGALSVADKPTVTCLRISDFNTKGLTGADKLYNSPWCNLIKSTGASDKSSSSGGSFGIGKFAPFACSAFRTVFYSTIAQDGHAAYQGVSRLTSFDLGGGDISQGIGYYGGENCAPLFTYKSLDPTFSRSSADSGTDIFVLAFNHDNTWKDDLIVSVLDSFLLAVYNDQLIVDVDGTIIDQTTLPSLMTEYASKFEENADKYYAVLSAADDKAKCFEEDIADMGKATLKMMIEPGMHRKCAMIRKTGMKIMDAVGFSSTIPFAAVLFIEGKTLNEYLRALENPQHTKWEPERSDHKTAARNVIRAIRKFVSESLKAMQQLNLRESIDPSVGEFLAYIEEKEKETKNEERKESISDKIKTVELKPIKINKPAVSNLGTDDGSGESTINDDQGDIVEEGPPGEGSGGQNGEGTGGGGGGGQFEGEGTGPHPGEKAGPNPTEHHKSAIHVRPASERQWCSNKDSGEYILIFKPSINAVNGTMKIKQSAESQNYDAALINVECDQDGVTFEGNVIKGLTFTANQAIKLTLTLDYHDYSSLEVEAYGYKV